MRKLLGLLMYCVSSAESAVFSDLHTIGMSLLILGRIVIAVLAFCTGKRDPCAHISHLRGTCNDRSP